jgi:serine/threonine protein kinase
MPDETAPRADNPTADWTISPTTNADTRPEAETPDAVTPAGTIAQSPEEIARAASASARGFGMPVVPGYEILDTLGEGGMGVVYKARQAKLNRVVALKMILDARADSRALFRFLAEAEAVAAVKHPNVVQVHDYGDAGGRPFMALEFLPGGTFAKLLEKHSREPVAIAKLVADIARGVAAAHALGIVHRDLKPSNVLLDDSGVPKVTDFGLAKRGTGSDLTAPVAKLGTPPYMCPEQVDGKTKFVGPQGDVWALGIILYESLTGTRPFNDADHQILYTQILTADPVPPRKLAPAIPRDLELICLK